VDASQEALRRCRKHEKNVWRFRAQAPRDAAA
jgi:hypothetical protein